MSRQPVSPQITSLPIAALMRDPNSAEEWHRAIEAWSGFIARHAASSDTSLRQMAMTARLRRGAAYAHLQEYDAAFADIEQVLSGQPDPYLACKTYELQATILGSLGRDREALNLWTQALALCQPAQLPPGEQAELFLERGKCYARLEHYQEALADFAQAVHIDAKLAEAYCWQGLTSAYLKQGAQALAFCTQAIELQPENATFWHIRGVVHRILNQFEQALTDLNQASTLAPDNDAIERDKRSTLLKWLLVGNLAASEDRPSAEQPSVASPSASPAPQKRTRRPASTKQGKHHAQQYAFFS